jgi:hypothetical protein
MRTQEKTFCGRERPHILARVLRQNPFGLRGVAPGHSVFAWWANLQTLPRPHSCQFLPEQTDPAHMGDPGPTKENPCLY